MNNLLAQRIMQQINVWGSLVSLGLLFWVNQWHYYVLCILSVLLISRIGNSAAQHRYFSHRSFETPLWKEKILMILGALSTTGSSLQWASVHRYHHQHSDRHSDIHSPSDIGLWRAWFHWYKKDPHKLIGPHLIKDLLRKPHLVWQHKYYFAIILTYVAILAMIDPWLVLFCYVIPAGHAMFAAGMITAILHYWPHGYRNFDTDDKSSNSHFWNLFLLGEGYHNNHHARPTEYDFAFTRRSGEWDATAAMIRTFFK